MVPNQWFSQTVLVKLLQGVTVTRKITDWAGIVPALSHRHTMMKKILLKISSAFVLTGILTAGCGGSDSSDSGDTTGGDTGGEPSTDTSALSHAGKPLPQNLVDPATTSLYSDIGRAKAQASSDNLAVIYEVIENQGSDAFPAGSEVTCATMAAEYASCSVTNLHIKDAAGALNDGNWKLYFHSIRASCVLTATNSVYPWSTVT